MLSEKISKPKICTRYKGKGGIFKNRILKSYDKKIICQSRIMGSCGANRGEFVDQSAIKAELDQIWIRPIRVSRFGHFWRRAKRREK